MIKSISSFFGVLITVCCLYSCQEKQPEITNFIIKGTTVNTTADTLHLFSPDQDFTFEKGIQIPVSNHQFEYELDISQPQGYLLMLDETVTNQGGRYLNFFVDVGVTELTIYDEDNFDSNIVKGSALNNDYTLFAQKQKEEFWDISNSYFDRLNVMQENKTYGTRAYYDLKEKQEATSDFLEKKYYYVLLDSLKKVNQYYSAKATPIRNAIDSISNKALEWKYEYINDRQDILGYYLFFESVVYDQDQLNYKDVFQTFEKLKSKFPNHPYTPQVEAIINGKQNIQIGNSFVDITAPTIDGEEKTISTLIKDKVAIINLWGSWCGPCIAKSKKIIPVYEKYKDNGFTVVGIAGEFDTTDALKKALARDQYPWINLVELDKAQNIWQQYGIQGGGAIFLVNQKGEIIAVNPTAYEIEEQLKILL